MCDECKDWRYTYVEAKGGGAVEAVCSNSVSICEECEEPYLTDDREDVSGCWVCWRCVAASVQCDTCGRRYFADDEDIHERRETGKPECSDCRHERKEADKWLGADFKRKARMEEAI